MTNHKIISEFGFKHKALRLVWGVCWLLLFLPSPRWCHRWRCFLLKTFGATIGSDVHVYNTVKVYFPPNLSLGDFVIVGPYVDLYCVGPIAVGSRAVISQYTYICAATHDYKDENFPLVALPISIGSEAWVCARAFVGPGVVVGSNSIVGACSVVTKDVESNHVVAGNPARFIKERPDPRKA